MDFAGVRALVVFPELEVVGGAAGVASALPEVDVFEVASELLELVVLPEFAAAVGSFVAVFESSAFAALDRDLRELALFSVAVVSPAVAFPVALAELPVELAVEPFAGVALADGSVASLSWVRLFFVGVVLTLSFAVVESAAAVLDLDRLFLEDVLLASVASVVADVPEALVDVSVVAPAESAFFRDLVFFGVVAESPAAGVAVVSVESAAGFFFLFFLVVVELVGV